MDRPRALGHHHCRAAALTNVCLERTIELDNVRIAARDWPGLEGPLVHLPDPLRSTPLIESLAAKLAPRYRVLSVLPRSDQPYQVQVADLAGVCAQFGFRDIVVAAEGLGCVTALLLGAWYHERVGALVLIDAVAKLPPGETLLTRSLRECPPDWPKLREVVKCHVADAAGGSAELIPRIESMLSSQLP